jgi:ligand-binding sensor domain-containing protein/class 3 adenylate cyclase
MTILNEKAIDNIPINIDTLNLKDRIIQSASSPIPVGIELSTRIDSLPLIRKDTSTKNTLYQSILLDEPMITRAGAIAQNPVNPFGIGYYGKLQGLQHDYVSYIIQDRRGNIWVATRGGGVSCFDGHFFSHFTSKQGLPSNEIWIILEDRKGNIWMGSNGAGLIRYDGYHMSTKMIENSDKNTPAKGKLTLTNATQFTTNEGLSGNKVMVLTEDKHGNIWVGTESGVSVFNGKSFFTLNKSLGLPGDVISSISEAPDGKIWIGTIETKKFSIFDPARIHHPCFNRICRHKLNDPSENAVHTKELFKTLSNYELDSSAKTNSIYRFLFDHQGRTWLGTERGLFQFSANKEIDSCLNLHCKHVLTTSKGLKLHSEKISEGLKHYSKEKGLTEYLILDLKEDNSGNIWIGTYGGGVFCFNGKQFENFNRSNGMPSNEVFSLLEARDGNIWIGAKDGGLCSLKKRGFYHINPSLGKNDISALALKGGTSGMLWMGLNDGTLSSYQENKMIKIQPTRPSDRNGLTCLETGIDNTLYAGTWGGGFYSYSEGTLKYYNQNSGFNNSLISHMSADKYGNIWLVCRNRGMVRFDGKCFLDYGPNQGLSGVEPCSVTSSADGTVWIGFHDGSINILNAEFTDNPCLTKRCLHQLNNISDQKEHTRLSRYWVTKIPNIGNTNFPVNALINDRKGRIWAGTQGNGLRCFDGKKSYHIRSEDGLVHDFVTSIIQDSKSDYWIGTRFGLSQLKSSKLDEFIDAKAHDSKLNKEFNMFSNFLYADGFLGSGCLKNGIAKTSDGKIWIATADRVTSFDPSIQIADHTIPVVQLMGLDMFNQKTDWTLMALHPDSALQLDNGVTLKNITFDSLSRWNNVPLDLKLPYDNNFINFRFIGTSVNSSHKIKYRYKLEGIDANWSAISEKTEAGYGNIPPGTYTFRLHAINGEGIVGRELAYIFTITPPWWKTWWAYSIYIFAAAGCLLSYIKWRERALKMRQKELEKKVDEATVVIRNEKERSENLLLNILPSEIADELKEKGASQARYMNDVTVLFTDFKGFTNLSEMLSPQDLVSEIHECFSAFDLIMEKYGVEKIKTIGDAYMAAGGLPLPKDTHALDVVKAALEIQAYMEHHKTKNKSSNKPFFEIRIGIHTGPVVAGIVGIKKFAYDIWGDTVNTASRMESSGEVGKVNISASTFNCIKNQFTCTYRGKIQAKGKGEIEMYFVEELI